MKVVLFCGGFGMRLREHSDSIPKPMVPIGSRPILLHLMKYYAHYGHKDFILCLGWKADVIKQYFLNYNECLSNDFVLSAGGKTISLFNRDIEDWNITFVDTGTSANIGQRLKAVCPPGSILLKPCDIEQFKRGAKNNLDRMVEKVLGEWQKG